MKKIRQIVVIVLCVLAGAGLLILTLSGPQLELYRRLYVAKPVRATGTITALEEKTVKVNGEKLKSVYPVVEFTTEDGKERKFRSEVTARRNMQVGDKTEVLFNSKKAVIRQEYVSARNALLIRLGSAVLAVLILTAAVLHAFFGKPKQKKKRRNPYKKYLWRI